MRVALGVLRGVLLFATTSGFLLNRPRVHGSTAWPLPTVLGASGGVSGEAPVVALTRELGKNKKLADLLAVAGVQTVEVPCIAHGVGSDRAALPSALEDCGSRWAYVVVTSPEAAEVLLQGWAEAGKPGGLAVASIGASSSVALRKGGVDPVFEPSKATAKTLSAELPVRTYQSLFFREVATSTG